MSRRSRKPRACRHGRHREIGQWCVRCGAAPVFNRDRRRHVERRLEDLTDRAASVVPQLFRLIESTEEASAAFREFVRTGFPIVEPRLLERIVMMEPVT